MTQKIRLNKIKRKAKRANERRFIIFCTVFMLAVIIAANVITTAFAAKTAESTIMYVSYGDTIWDIAEDIRPDTIDVRRVVNEIMRLNKLEGAQITAGQTIVVPIY